MPPKKRKLNGSITNPDEDSPSSSSHKIILPNRLEHLQIEWGASEDPLNSEKGFCTLPLELTTEILAYFQPIGPYTTVDSAHARGPVLKTVYLDRPDTLRALSQTCITYRRLFLPLLWENLDVCVEARGRVLSFYKHVGNTLVRKSNGLRKNQDLAVMVRTVNVVLTRYQAGTVLASFVKCLRSLPNLRTIHILHAHTQMTTPLKSAFEGKSFPSIHSLIIPGYCHEILKTCPNVKKVHCIRENGSKLVTVMGKNCPHVEEIRGFGNDEGVIKRLVKAAPNLRILELEADPLESTVKILPKFIMLETIDIKHPCSRQKQHKEFDFQPTINKLRPIFKAKSTPERKYIRTSRMPDGFAGEVLFTSVGLD